MCRNRLPPIPCAIDSHLRVICHQLGGVYSFPIFLHQTFRPGLPFSKQIALFWICIYSNMAIGQSVEVASWYFLTSWAISLFSIAVNADLPFLWEPLWSCALAPGTLTDFPQAPGSDPAKPPSMECLSGNILLNSVSKMKPLLKSLKPSQLPRSTKLRRHWSRLT